MKAVKFLNILVTFFLCQSVYADEMQKTVVIVSSANNKHTQVIAEQLKAELIGNEALGAIDVVIANDTIKKIKNSDTLTIYIGSQNATHQYNDQSVIHAFFNANDLNKKPVHSVAVVNDQPLENIVNVANQLVVNRYKNKIVIAVSESNQYMRDAISRLDDLLAKSVVIVEVKKDDNVARLIEDYLYDAAALIAIRDSAVWSKKNAAWLLRQSYTYQVPVVGFSKAFVNAGAMVSVYSKEDHIIEEVVSQVENWLQNEKVFEGTVIYPRATVEVNENVAEALGFSPDKIKKIKELGDDF